MKYVVFMYIQTQSQLGISMDICATCICSHILQVLDIPGEVWGPILLRVHEHSMKQSLLQRVIT